MSLPIVDVAPLLAGRDDAAVASVASDIGRACEEDGFFYVTGHGVDPRPLERLARQFFARPLVEKMEIAMARGGVAWRGYFPVGGELTSGRPDLKEGLYLGAELGPDHPRVKAGTPLHGANLWPRSVPELRGAVLEHIARMTAVSQAIARGLSLSLSLAPDHVFSHYTSDPTVLFRIFQYPPAIDSPALDGWGVGEHTDYGLLTLLVQDEAGGLEVKTRKEGWISAPPIEGAMVANIGDMLDKLTGGRFRSTPHRVRNRSGRERISMPFFFDPGWDARLVPLHSPRADLDRWDHADVHAFDGTYGAYLARKVARVFPKLFADVIATAKH